MTAVADGAPGSQPPLKITAGRPYRSMRELARTGIPREVLDRISPPGIIILEDVRGPLAVPATPIPGPIRRGARP